MPVRIYALAKELKLDSKKLVDICTKAGITGKGSALASLSDEEAIKVRAFLSGGARPAATKTVAPGKPAPSRPAAKDRPPEEGVVRREDYMPPAGVHGRVPVLDEKPKKAEKSEPAKGLPQKTPARSAPTIKLAPVPASEKPAKSDEKSPEPVPQKPDLKLPADAIRASKAGSKPLADHLRRHEAKAVRPEKKTAEKRPIGPKKKAPGFSAELASKSTSTPAETPSRGRRRGKDAGQKPEGDAPLLGGREQRQLSRKRAGARRQSDDDDTRPRRARRAKRMGVNTAAPRKGKVSLQVPCTIRTFSEATGVPATSILKLLLREGTGATLNSELEVETTELIAEELGVEVELRPAVSDEDQWLSVVREDDDPDSLVTRPPVITFLGHVDHGKTSLLDRIIGSDIVSGESGGITQYIRAFQIEKNGHTISFVDTPGHQAFTEMRARGANVTDIVVLVVAADDGVMPQTEEAISHSRAADVPIVVALNKSDLPGADANRAMQQLSACELLPSEWGGDVEVVNTSAMTGDGIDELLDTLLTVAELHDHKANPNRPAYGTCIESQQETGRGTVAKLIVQNGTLKVGDVLVCGKGFGRVKAMYDTLRTDIQLESAGPSTPVNITGLDVAPDAGERFYILEDIAKARTIAQSRTDESREKSLGGGRDHVTLENLFERLEGDGQIRTLNVILRADVRGSIEAIQNELGKLVHPEVKIRLLQATVGGITEADVQLADASDAVILGFNVVPEEGARILADRQGVQIRRYDVIYKLTDDLKAALEGMLKPEQREVELGRALVQQTFSISRVGTIAGCRALSGTIERNARVRVIRQNTIIGNYPLDTLKRGKDDAKEVREGMECGIKLGGFDDVKEADVFEVYKVEEVGRKFDQN